MAKHISSIDYKYIPIEYVIATSKLNEVIRKKDKQIKELLKDNVKLRRNNEK